MPLPWLNPEKKTLNRNFEPVHLASLLEECGVDGTVIVQAAHDEVETDWLLELSRDYPFIKGVVGWVDLTAPDLSDRLDRFKSKGPFCGTRYPLLNETGLDQAAVRGLTAFAEKDLACDLLVRFDQLQPFTELFRAREDLPLVINHLAIPPLKTGELENWQAAITGAARYPNVFCKVSGMVTLVNPAMNFEEQVRPYFEKVLELFGPDRLLWGSDWPVSLQGASYRQVHDLLAALVSRLSPGEQAAIWGGTAARVYKIAGANS
ncbi:MAG: amidohydrolase [Chloroflexi bacterium]|nr:amidohydrolase [Chloroflexota bacterium]